MLSRESRPCLSEREKQNAFSVFIFFRESHGFASTRGTVVISREARACLFRKGKNRAPGLVFSSGFFAKKVRQNLSTWNLILKISTRGIQW